MSDIYYILNPKSARYSATIAAAQAIHANNTLGNELSINQSAKGDKVLIKVIGDFTQHVSESLARYDRQALATIKQLVQTPEWEPTLLTGPKG